MAVMAIRWYVNCTRWTPSNQEWIKCIACIQEEESSRINQFVFKEDAKRALAGRLLARQFLIDLTNVSNSSLKLERTPYGKPYLVSSSNGDFCGVDFSISHHGDYTIIAGQENSFVGADIMDTTQKGSQSTSNFFHTMRRQFTEDEWRYIRGDADETTQLSRFYRLWCLKESYVKALGRGIGFGVQRINCHPGILWSPLATVSLDTKLSIDGEQLEGWTFEEHFIDSKHCVAVAVKPHRTLDHLNRTFFSECTISDLIVSMDTIQEIHPHNWTIFSNKCSKEDSQRR